MGDIWIPFNATDMEDAMRTPFNDPAVTPCSTFEINKIHI